jgi:MFS family permease
VSIEPESAPRPTLLPAGPGDQPPRSGTSFRVLRQRDFALCWSASLISTSGAWMQSVAVPFVIYQMTKSTTWLGFAAFMSFIPTALGGPLGGSLADRHSRQRILLLTQTGSALTAAAIWVVWISGAATPGLIVAILCVSGFLGGMGISAWQAFITQLVGPDELVDAVRLNSMQFTGAKAFGPALAALVLETLGPSAAFLTNALSYLLVIAALLVVHPRGQSYSDGRGSVVADIRDGVRFVRHRTSLALPMVVILVASVFGTSTLQLAPAVADDVFDVGRGAYGLLITAYGVGSVVGTVWLATTADRVPMSRFATWGGLGLALCVVALGLAPAYAVGLVIMALFGLGYTLLTTSLQTSVQLHVEDRYRARTMSIYTSSQMLGVPLGALVLGELATVLDLRVVLVGAGALLCSYLAYVAVRYNRLRLLDGAIPGLGRDEVVTTRPAVALD